MKTDTLTGPNLSMQVAILDGRSFVRMDGDNCYEWDYFADAEVEFDYEDAEVVMRIAERELIGVHHVKCEVTDNITWRASMDKKSAQDNERYQRYVVAFGGTMAEAMMRCYVKSYLGDDTKGE